MKHLFFASHFEAKPFLHDSMSKINESPEVYEADYRVVIIGTGLVQAAANTSSYFEKYALLEKDSFINMGIAGSVANKRIGDIFEIAEVQMFCVEQFPDSSKNIWEASYPDISLEIDGLKLGTSLHPIWGSKFHTLLAQQEIDLVDMEGYAFMQVCKVKEISARIIKSVSDDLFKNRKIVFSKMLKSPSILYTTILSKN